MVTFRNNNNLRRKNYRRSDRNFKSNPGRDKFSSNFSNNDNFQRKIPGRNNHNAPKLIEKYNNLAREALSTGDKILSENYFQHADHFTRVLGEQSKLKNDKFAENSSKNIETPNGSEKKTEDSSKNIETPNGSEKKTEDYPETEVSKSDEVQSEVN